MKTSELTGKALNIAVAVSLGCNLVKTPESQSWMVHWPVGLMSLTDPRWTKWAPDYSGEWALGGPIIERERICATIGHAGVWLAFIAQNYEDHKEFMRSGPTPLIAAMRCFVASRLGDEVDVPVELLPTQLDADKAALAQAQRAFKQNPTPSLSTVIKRLAASIDRREKSQ